MNVEIGALVGAAAVIVIAAVSAFAKLLSYLDLCMSRERDARHKLQSEIAAHILEVEERLTRRLERIEHLSFGFAAQYQRPYKDRPDE